ncbi:hypothetical protein C8D87_1011542 [Lentzea atacamensis]|uniref:Uncharacterized protein n=1 Tax=Lentzea atacamensis TaxID=531938 RepID=A0ABX9EJ72_9PSEU|nr:hypothetical protein [Lentzea atacamensis]RAS71241.1 hypothetical protein C8D87_1011542 [Lentzea atacamensis]
MRRSRLLAALSLVGAALTGLVVNPALAQAGLVDGEVDDLEQLAGDSGQEPPLVEDRNGGAQLHVDLSSGAARRRR